MGKSPGKWIKTVLFGKKSSKSNIAKRKEKFSSQKEALSNKTYESNVVPDPPIISHIVQANLSKSEGRELDNKENENVLYEREIPLQENHGSETRGVIPHDSALVHEKMRLEEAAIKAQAAFRGYLARRAFWTLKGIIRLQALIRGHLVRRQAVATLCCMNGIVKFQAVVRGRMVRSSDVEFKKCNLREPVDGMPIKRGTIDISTKIAKSSANVFIQKLLASSPKAMPMHLKYNRAEPNSVPNWLENWSRSCFWKPLPQPKNISDSKPQRKQSNIPTVEPHNGKMKLSFRKLPAANADTASAHAISESEKPKRSVSKVSGQLMDSVNENPQIELEKVKRSLRKVQNPIIESAVQSEVEAETPNQQVEKALVTSGDCTQFVCDSSENINKEAPLMISNVLDVEATLELLPLATTDSSKMPNSDQVLIDSMVSIDITAVEENVPDVQEIEDPSLTNGISNHENNLTTNGEVGSKETAAVNESQKSSRKASTPAKLDRADNDSQSPILPSYMTATKSAKAKLRAQGSARFGLESSERNNVTRRHSLPSANDKLSSHSPRTQKLVQSGGRGGNRTDRSSRDGNGRAVQVEWRR